MKTVIYTDNTIPLAIEQFCELLNATCEKFEFKSGKEKLRLNTSTISFPDSYKDLPKQVIKESKNFDLSFLCTSIPYDNNFFFEYDERLVILISFSDWNQLTDLPITNGLVYFIASIICDEFGIVSTHEEDVGCVNDFWWDKKGIDVGMRAAFICPDCRTSYSGDPSVLKDIQSLLDLVSHASRSEKDVLQTVSLVNKSQNEFFDVFMCHNNDDKSAVRKLNNAFKTAGIRTWLDEEELPPGVPWQPELEKHIGSVRRACVFVGENGIGPWQNFEIRAFLSEFVNRGCPVIPVIMPDAKKVPELPIFLKQMTWIDLRKNYQKNLLRLVGALKRN